MKSDYGGILSIEVLPMRRYKTLTTIVGKIESGTGRKKVEASTFLGGGKVLRSDESYEEFFHFIDQKIIEVTNDRAKANDALHRTGMYDRNGRPKKEFR